jgi:lambda repressor-like predicted transcriptional regulator
VILFQTETEEKMIPEKTPKKGVAYDLFLNFETYMRSTQDAQLILMHGIREDGSFKPEAIRALLRFKKVNITALAVANGFSETFFRRVINCEKKNVKIENIIAEHVGIEPDRMWGRMLCEVGNAN